MLVQAVVDHDYLFRDICVGWPGSVHDARVFTNSMLYGRITEDDLIAKGDTHTLLGNTVHVCTIGDAAYPPETWLMKPLTDNGSLTEEEKCFSYRLCCARIVVENAFGRLKARWRRLMKRNDMHTETQSISLLLFQPVVFCTMCVKFTGNLSMTRGYSKVMLISNLPHLPLQQVEVGVHHALSEIP